MVLDPEQLFRNARELDAAGREAEARRAYLAVLELAPRHFGALTNLASLLERRGFAAPALQGYREAVQSEPDNPIGHVNLAGALLEGGEIAAARESYETALRLAPACAEAHQGLAAAFARLGNDAAALRHRALGFRERAIVHAPFRGTGKAPGVLVLLSTLGGNVDLRQFLDDRRFDVWKVFVDALESDLELPAHDLAVNAIGDADLCGQALHEAVALLKRTTARTINDPRYVLSTGRLEIARRLSSISGAVVPRMAQIERDRVEKSTREDFAFPFLIRAPGHHTGERFVRVDDAAQLPAAVSALSAPELLAIQYVDTRGKDGMYRKYRVMLVDQNPYPLHLAISPSWMVHYFSGQTLDDPGHRAEEKRFLEDMGGVLGSSSMRAVEVIAQTLGLDYAGVDFALDRAGNIVIFEANATMTIPNLTQAPDDYRRPALARLCSAVDAMFRSKLASAQR